MPGVSRSAVMAAPSTRVLAYADDVTNLARRMREERSKAMTGPRPTLEIAIPEVAIVGATYRHSDRTTHGA